MADAYDPMCEYSINFIIGTSTRQLNRILKQYYSMTFNERLTYSRLELAKNLLKNTYLSVKEICEAIGFYNSNYFSSVFRKMSGIPPTLYRIKFKSLEL